MPDPVQPGRAAWILAVFAGTVLASWVQGITARAIAADGLEVVIHWQGTGSEAEATLRWDEGTQHARTVTVPAGDSPETRVRIGYPRSLANLLRIDTVKGSGAIPAAVRVNGEELEQAFHGAYRLPTAHLMADRIAALAGVASGALAALILGFGSRIFWRRKP